MRVVHVIDRLQGGGQERVAAELALALVSRVELAGLLATRGGGDYERMLEGTGVRTLVASRSARWDPRPWLRIARFMRAANWDIIHTHSPGSLAAAVALRRVLRLRAAIVAHLQMLPPPETPFRSRAEAIYRRYSAEIAVGIVTNEQLRGFLVAAGVDSETVELVPNPVDVRRFEPQWDKPERPFRVAMVAQWRAQKDHITAIRAADILRRRGRELEWLFIGERDATLTRSAEELIARAGLGGTTRVVGRRTDVEALLRSTHVGVLATHFEGSPVAVAEYASAGLPIVVTDVEGTSHLIDASKGVVGVPSLDAVALADQVESLMDDAARREELGRAARRFAEMFFDSDAVAGHLVQLYGTAVRHRLVT